MAAFVLLASPSTAAGQRSSAAEGGRADVPPLISDDPTAPDPDGVTDPHGQHGTAAGHLPPVRHNVELVSKLEMSTPADLRTPETADQPVLPGQIADVAVYKNFAYLNSWSEPTCRRGGIFVVDISNPAAPQQVAFRSASPNTRHGEGAHVVTVNTPVGPRDILAVNNEPLPPPCPQNVPSAGGIDLWDVTNPRDPQLLTRSLGDTGGPGSLIGTDAVHHAHSTFLWRDDSGRAFAVMTDNDEFGTYDVDIWEITTPAVPRPVAEHNLQQLFPIEDNSAYGDTSYHHDVVVKNIGGVWTMLVSYWDAGYVTLNVNDPANAQYIGDTSFDGPDPLTGFVPPEGNAHQAEFSHDSQYILAADEDFNACRFDAAITSGPFTDAPLIATQGSDVPGLCPDNDLDDQTRYVGEACTAGGPLPAPAGASIALVARGTCTFQEKYDNVVAAGYDAGIVFNSNSASSGCDSLLTMLVEGDEIPFLFIPRTMGFQILGIYDESTYTCTPGGAATPITTAQGTLTSSVKFLALFDGWGYAHLYRNGSGKIQRVDSHAIEEALSSTYAVGYGDLSIHEFATDPTENVAYSSYYSGGMRVFTFGPGGLTEQGKFIDEGGNDFWGVEQFTLGNQRYFAGSDRDFGLYVFRYTGPGAAQRPVCSDSVTMVPYRGSATVSLSCTDANGNALTRTIVSGPRAGTLSGDPNTGTVRYQHTGSRLGADRFTFKAADGSLESEVATARIVVVPGDRGRCFNAFAGTARRDGITGSPFGDAIRGGRGNDRIDGLGGHDCLFGDRGRDQLLGNTGNDRLAGGPHPDRLFGGPGRDVLLGAGGSDHLRSSSGHDRLDGGRGRDFLNGGSNDDRVSGGPGNDRVRGGEGRDRVFGNGGHDWLEAGDARNLLSGGGGDDELVAANGSRDTIRCGDGVDEVRADRIDRVAGDCEVVLRA